MVGVETNPRPQRMLHIHGESSSLRFRLFTISVAAPAACCDELAQELKAGAHRSLWMRMTQVAKVGVLDPLGTVSSSR